jgi:hypothetical protein
MTRIEKLRAAENLKAGTVVPGKKVSDNFVVADNVKKQTRQFSIEAEIEDIEKLKSAILKLSNRDNILHKK